MVASLTIQLFGPMQVLMDGQPLPPVRSRKVLWLLALLTLRHGRPVAREWIAGTLWPDTDHDAALANLRPVIHGLRAALGTGRERLRSPDRATLLLDLEGADVDLIAFDEAIARGDFEAAAARYAGPMLEGCTEEWAPQERNAREQDYARALQTLGDAALADGNASKAIERYRRLALLDPLRDGARRGLMEAYAQAGDVNAALQTYRDFVHVLRSEVGLAPDERTTALYHRLRKVVRNPAPAPVAERPAPKVEGNLPHALTPLVGREDERLDVAAKLPRHRLVTLVGPGGIGKTRLATHVAHEVVGEFPDGVWLVPLEFLNEGRLVGRQVAAALGLPEAAERSPLERTVEALRKKRLLIVLDNCEHVLDACVGLCGPLLRECPGVRLLCTSREALGIMGESVLSVPALACPDPKTIPEGGAARLRALQGYEGIQLFRDRAQAASPTFELTGENLVSVTQICHRLGGVPLAIEFAAARVRTMPVDEIAARLDDRLRLLTSGNRGAASRQQTLRSTLDWSYDLLNADERRALSAVSVFAGGWTLDAAEAVVPGAGPDRAAVADLLAALVEKSLASLDGRYRLLETVRQYAAEKLRDASWRQSVEAGLREWCGDLAAEAASGMKGPDQEAWLARLDAEMPNVREALATGDQDPSLALRIAGPLWRYWYLRGRYAEGREILEGALDRSKEPSPERARAAYGAGCLAFRRGDYGAAQALLEESLRLNRVFGDDQGVATTLDVLGNIALDRGETAAAKALYEESLSQRRKGDDPRALAGGLFNMGNLFRSQGEYASARALYEEGLDLARRHGLRHELGLCLIGLGCNAFRQGDYGGSRLCLEESLGLAQEAGYPTIAAWCLTYLSQIALEQGDPAQAVALAQGGVDRFRELGQDGSRSNALHRLAIAALEMGDVVTARSAGQEAFDIAVRIGARQEKAEALGLMVRFALGEDESLRARRLAEESLRLHAETGDPGGVAEGLEDLALALSLLDEHARAVGLRGSAEALRERFGIRIRPSGLARYAHGAAHSRAALGEAMHERLWAEGRAMDWREAVERALAWEPDSAN